MLLKVDLLPSRESDPYDAPYANAAVLHRAGVRFAIVSDDAENARNLPYEAAMAAAYGLPAAEALRAITLSPAEIFGVADRVGAIAPGRDASLVLATGDILDTRTHVTHVWIDGAAQSLETRHTGSTNATRTAREPSSPNVPSAPAGDVGARRAGTDSYRFVMRSAPPM